MENKAVEDQVAIMLEKQVIRKSKSPYCASPVVVPKPDEVLYKLWVS